MSKISIRFFNDREVRAVWDDGAAKWWFGAVDVAGALSGSANARNYWYVLKNRLKKAGDELLTKCKGFKMTAPDGKRCVADSSGLRELLRSALTDKIDDRETFMKGIDYSYYHEEGA